MIELIETPPLVVQLSMPQLTITSPSQQGVSGLRGLQGIPGPPGADGTNTLLAFERVAPTDGAQTMTLPYAVASGWHLLCVNGLRQPAANYSVSGDALNLPSGLDVSAGDLISFDFYPVL